MQTRKGSGLRDTIPGGFYIGHNNAYADERSRYPKVSGEVNRISDAVAGRVHAYKGGSTGVRCNWIPGCADGSRVL